MGLMVDVRQSHRYTFLTPINLAFKVTLVPTGTAMATGMHYIILVDASGSMKGKKIRMAKEGARMLVERIPDGNYVTIIAFGLGRGEVQTLASRLKLPEGREEALRAIEKLRAEDGTPLYHALLAAWREAEASDAPGFIVLLSDGIATDVTDLDAYRKLGVPPGYKMVLVGIGTDYNHELFTVLADMSGGDFYHLSEEEVDRLPEIMASFAVEAAAARYVEVEFKPEDGVEGPRLLNYAGSKVSLPTVNEPVTIYGEVTVPKLYKGRVLTIKVSYMDVEQDRRVEIEKAIEVDVAEDRDTFLKGIDRDLLDEYNYMLYMAKAREAIVKGNLEEATRKIQQAEKLAAQTRKITLIEATRRLAQEVEATKRLSGARLEDATKRLASEVTRKLRRGG